MNSPIFPAQLVDMSLLDRLTVYSHREHNNRRFKTTYFGHDKESVEAKALQAKADCDHCSSPSLSGTRSFIGRINGGEEREIFEVTLTTYSLD